MSDSSGQFHPLILNFWGCHSLPCESYVFLGRFVYHSSGGKYKRVTMTQLLSGLDAVAWFMSSYIHPINPIQNKYKNHPKGHKLGGLVLVGGSNRNLWRKVVAAPVYSFLHVKFHYVDFSFFQNYVYVKEQGPEENLLDPPEAPSYQSSAAQPIDDAESNN